MKINLVLTPHLIALWYQSFLDEGIPKNEAPIPNSATQICLYPRSYIERIEYLGFEKEIDFNFRGGFYIDRHTRHNRKWIFKFAQKHFTNRSFFQITDRKAKTIKKNGLRRHKLLGLYDYTFDRSGFVPKEKPINERMYFDAEYFEVLCLSEFTLCPAGDSPWSMRFYEAILSKSIPIVEKPEHIGRNRLEHAIEYRYYLKNDRNIKYRKNWADDNFEKFMKYQTLIGK